MFSVDLTTGWLPVPGTAGVNIKPLSGDFDEAAQTGFRTRYVRFGAGGETFEALTHRYWEEAFLVDGTLTVKSDGSVLKPPCYVIRPPGTPHGPLSSATGCLLIEFQYFTTRAVGSSDFLDRLASAAADDTQSRTQGS